MTAAMLSLWHVENISKQKPFARMTNQDVLDKLEVAFKKLQHYVGKDSVLGRTLTPEIFELYKYRQTKNGVTLYDVIKSGVELMSNDIVGIHAPDAESYRVFADLFDPVIAEIHFGFQPKDEHPSVNYGDIESLKDVDPIKINVLSTRITCSRNLKDKPFGPLMNEDDYLEVERKITETLSELEDDIKGTYEPLSDMNRLTCKRLLDEGLMLQEGDIDLELANSNHYWPTGRGVYYNEKMTFVVWVNGDDHLTIISSEKGGDLKKVYKRMVGALKEIGYHLPFCRDERLGFLTVCPQKLGTAMRISMCIKLPNLYFKKEELRRIAGEFDLKVVFANSEDEDHAERTGGDDVDDNDDEAERDTGLEGLLELCSVNITNKWSLGKDEGEVIQQVQIGIMKILKEEAKFEVNI